MKSDSLLGRPANVVIINGSQKIYKKFYFYFWMIV